jgi:hypothetical protein
MNTDTTPSIASTTKHECDDSAIILLLKKMVSGTSRVLGGIVDLTWDEDQVVRSVHEAGIIDLFGIEENEDYGMCAGLPTFIFLPYLSPLLKILAPQEYKDEMPIDPKTQDNTSPETLSKIQSEHVDGGLVCPAADVMKNLDFVITQMDIARFERAASRRLRVGNIHHLPTIIYGNGNDLICPSYEDGIHEDADEHEHLDQANIKEVNTQLWSWMVVPRENDKDLTRIAGTNQNVPECISVCSSTRSVGSGQGCMDASFDHCVICKYHFQEGDMLRVLV